MIYYCDDKNTILNGDGQTVGYFIEQCDKTKKMYMIKLQNEDTRTYQEVIDSIECNT